MKKIKKLALAALLGITSVALAISIFGAYINKKYFTNSGVIKQNLFLEQEASYYLSDDLAGHKHKPNINREFSWEEHDLKKIVMKTNNLGFRENLDTREIRAAGTTRILVTGDSHIDGVVNNSESFPNQLEILLNESNPLSRYEVINGGTGYYGPQNYHGFLKRYLYLAPDIYIVVIYTGNDFIDAIKIKEMKGSLIPPKIGYFAKLNYILKLVIARKIAGGTLHQALAQIFYFKWFPEMKKTALKITQSRLRSINELCQKRDCKFMVVFLPTKLDVEWQTDAQQLDRVKNLLRITDNDFNLNQSLKKSLGFWLSQNNIQFFDLQEHFTFNQGLLFWNHDYHLSKTGHRLAAEALFKSWNSFFYLR